MSADAMKEGSEDRDLTPQRAQRRRVLWRRGAFAAVAALTVLQLLLRWNGLNGPLLAIGAACIGEMSYYAGWIAGFKSSSSTSEETA